MLRLLRQYDCATATATTAVTATAPVLLLAPLLLLPVLLPLLLLLQQYSLSNNSKKNYKHDS